MINIFFRILDSLGRRYAKFIWSLRLKEVGEDTVFDAGIKIYNPQNVCIGSNCVINNGVILQSCENGEIVVGDNVTISYNSIFLTCNLDLDKYQETKVHFSKDIVIEDNVWIGMYCFIGKGVTIGEGSIVARQSVIMKDVPPYSIVAGNPARVVKTLKKPLK